MRHSVAIWRNQPNGRPIRARLPAISAKDAKKVEAILQQAFAEQAEIRHEISVRLPYGMMWMPPSEIGYVIDDLKRQMKDLAEENE